jgi:hypothetical protein
MVFYKGVYIYAYICMMCNDIYIESVPRSKYVSSRNQSVSAAKQNIHSFCLRSYETHYFTLWSKCRIFHTQTILISPWHWANDTPYTKNQIKSFRDSSYSSLAAILCLWWFFCFFLLHITSFHIFSNLIDFPINFVMTGWLCEMCGGERDLRVGGEKPLLLYRLHPLPHTYLSNTHSVQVLLPLTHCSQSQPAKTNTCTSFLPTPTTMKPQEYVP